MQHVDYAGELHRVDCSVRVAVVVLDHLQDAGPVKALKRLGIGVHTAGLGVKQGLPESLPDALRELP